MYQCVVHCSSPGCAEPAAYKIAARWRDGTYSELKTYGFACSDHLGKVFQDAEERQIAVVDDSAELRWREFRNPLNQSRRRLLEVHSQNFMVFEQYEDVWLPFFAPVRGNDD